MTKGFLRFLRRNTIALLALFVALGGTTYAASTALIAKNTVASPQVVNGSLQTKDLSKKARLALKGNRGLRGPAGAQGAQGAQGAKGATGTAGVSATKLFAAVSADCASLDRGSGATGVGLDFPARCDIAFNQSVKNCVPVVSAQRDAATGNFSGHLAAATSIAGTYAALTDNEVGVIYFDGAGATSSTIRPPLYVAVFC